MADFDLAILGSGSGNSIISDHFDDKRVALVEAGVFGGTCLNRGCIPTKMYVYAAEVAETISGSERYGIDAHIDRVRWADIRDRIFGRIDPISAGGRAYRQDADNVSLFTGEAHFDGERSIVVSGQPPFTAEQVVIATGARPTVPDVVAASDVAWETSDTVMRIPRLPETIVILGGGYIAAEFAHVFSSLGVDVRVVTRGAGLLTALDAEISRRFTALARRRWDVTLSATVSGVRRRGEGGGVVLSLDDGASVEGDLLLVATGRRPNSDGLALPAAGVAVHPDGRVRVDEFGRTTAENVWAIGDVSSAFQLKHVANSEARTVAHNLVKGAALQRLRHHFVPSAVFTDPQIASVGATIQELEASGRRFVTSSWAYGDTAFGWAMEDRDGLCRLYADPQTGLLLGAHLMGYQASSLIQPLIQAMAFGQPAPDVARQQYWIHPALSEVLENALLQLPLD